MKCYWCVLTALIVSLAVSATLQADTPIRRPDKFNPDDRTVDVFAAMEAGEVEVKFIPKDEKEAVLLVENKTDKPLNIKMPEAFAGVPVLGQFGGGGLGGGGLGGGGPTAVRHIKPPCRIIGVQPEASPAARLSFAQNRAIDPYDHAPTIADGLAGGFGAAPFQLLQAHPPEIVLVSEAQIRQAILALLAEHQLVIEPSGAAAFAPLLAGLVDVAEKTAVCILTGGNLALDLLREVVNR